MKIHYKPLSRYFPKGHINEGEPTYFVEKILNSIEIDFTTNKYVGLLNELNPNMKSQLADFLFDSGFNYKEYGLKHHTIRKGNKVKVGDFIQFYVWSGKPYHSKWIKPFPPIEVIKVWNFEKDLISDNWYLDGLEMSSAQRIDLAINDGLDYKDLLAWFKEPFSGQIICWNDSINYK